MLAVQELCSPRKRSFYPIGVPARELSLPVMNNFFQHIEKYFSCAVGACRHSRERRPPASSRLPDYHSAATCICSGIRDLYLAEYGVRESSFSRVDGRIRIFGGRHE